MLRAWEILAEKVLVDNGIGIWGHGTIFQGLPQDDFKSAPSNRWSDHTYPYQQSDLVAALYAMATAAPACRQADGYQFDIVNLTRQALSNQAAIVQARMQVAAEAKDLAGFRREAGLFLGIGGDLDELLGTRHEFLLGRWLADARSWGATAAEQAYYEHDARQIITTWHTAGACLDDYGNRQWNGLMRGYYLERWNTSSAWTPPWSRPSRWTSPPTPTGAPPSKSAGWPPPPTRVWSPRRTVTPVR